MKGKKIFITGATGFIGSAMARRLVGEGAEVHALVRTGSNRMRVRDIESRIIFHEGDITNSTGLRQILHDLKPHGIFHFAMSGIMSGVTAPTCDVIEGNFIGTVNLMDASSDVDYDFFINTGSFLEYGPKDHPISELEICRPLDIYSLTKLAGTLYGQAAASKGKPIVTFRLFTPYGPRNQTGRLAQLVPFSAIRGLDINLTHPDIARDFIFVEDIVDLYLEAALKAGRCGGEIFNVGSGLKTTLKQFVDAVFEITKSQSHVNWNSFRSVSYDSDFWQADMSKTFSSFDWRPRHTLEEGLNNTISWIKDNPDLRA